MTSSSTTTLGRSTQPTPFSRRADHLHAITRQQAVAKRTTQPGVPGVVGASQDGDPTPGAAGTPVFNTPQPAAGNLPGKRIRLVRYNPTLPSTLETETTGAEIGAVNDSTQPTANEDPGGAGVSSTQAERSDSAATQRGVSSLQPSSDLLRTISEAYEDDPNYQDPKFLKKLRQDGDLWYFCDQVAVPHDKTIRQLILKEFHDANLAGHLGITKTYYQVARRFWWPKLKRSVESYVNSCPTCQTTKASRQATGGLLQPLPILERHRTTTHIGAA